MQFLFLNIDKHDNNRGGGDSRENRRSLAEFIGFDSSQYSEPAATPKHEQQRPNEIGSSTSTERDWRWEEWEAPGSPEAAQTPRSLVPPACFPPRHPNTFASYSESARPGSWAEDTPGQISDLVASLKSLAMMPSPSTSGSLHMSTERHGYEIADKTVEPPWPPEQASICNDANTLPRGAFFCGVVRRGAEGEALRWCGALPPRGPEPGAESAAAFSPKVFLGGLPWDITEQALMHSLRHFYPLRVEWPGREGGGAGGAGGAGAGEGSAPRGYAYVTFESERRVRALLAAARRDGHDWYYRIASHNMRTKEVQVIPWAVGDSNWVRAQSARLEPARTVFVGALHGMLSAYALALIMNDLFSGVVYAGIDTDKNKYPIGSGRVTFNNVHSYVKAISAAYVEISTDKFTKTIQVDPYLEDSMCSLCNLQQGPYFCREPVCFRYFCRSCWAWQHQSVSHKQLMRNSKSAQGGAPAVLRRSPPAAAPPHAPLPAAPPAPLPAPLPAPPLRSHRRHAPDQTCYNGGSNGTGRPSEGTPLSGSSGTSELEPSTASEVAAESWVLH
ncbi:unnamed protein product [Parnassius mnemosyne]|uniref:RRM domain-containing protein n=1 Tax=Parnassius mnemosyne TaxID=213953 RepID=A0AAV1K7V7_9NEOP